MFWPHDDALFAGLLLEAFARPAQGPGVDELPSAPVS